MSSVSIIFKDGKHPPELSVSETNGIFLDLNLDQLFRSALPGERGRDLEVLFRMPLSDEASIKYRQDALRDLESRETESAVKEFSRKIEESERYSTLSRESRGKERADGWFLEAALAYRDAVKRLAAELSAAKLSSKAFKLWREWLNGYALSAKFREFSVDADEIKRKLSDARYTVRVKENTCVVRRYAREPDYEAEIERVFAKFQENTVKDHLKSPKTAGSNHVKEMIIECVAKLYPETFKDLAAFHARYDGFIDDRIREFDRESRFLLAYLDYIAPLRMNGLSFCYPRITREKGEISAVDAFDLPLARKLSAKNAEIVTNNFYLNGKERILVVSGPNQGGKTTFARTFGQTHYLARLGFPVPGKLATLLLSDRIATHFDCEEDIANLRGELQDDLIRIRDILRVATPDSIILLNEIFNSTTLKDGLALGMRILKKIAALDSVCVLVTFMEELSRAEFDDPELNGKIVSMVGATRPDNPAERTYEIVRRKADGRAYAKVMAEKYRLTRGDVAKRMARE